MTLPASIRNKNPGAMWPGKASKKFGSRVAVDLADGAGNKMAVFGTNIDGAAALWYLLETAGNGRKYVGKSIADVLLIWSGNTHTNAYIAAVEKRTSLSRHDFLDLDLLHTPHRAIELAKAMAWHEAGRAYPMSDDEWRQAHAVYMQMRDVKQADPVVAIERAGPSTRHLDWARSHLGEKEIPGAEANPFILQCFADVGRADIKSDEVANCAAFVGAALKNSGMHYNHGSLTARSYLNYGEPLSEPEPGAIVVFWRDDPRSWKGHVAIVESYTDKRVTYIGANQGDAVTRLTSPRVGPKSQVLGYRRAIPAKAPVAEVVAEPSVKYKATSLLALIAAFFADGFAWLGGSIANGAQAIGEAVGALPQAANEATHVVGSAKALTATVGLPWPVYVSLAIAIVAIGYNLYGTWQRKRNRLEKPAIGDAG